VATTGWRFSFLTLGLMFRRIVVDTETQTVAIHRRYGWLFGGTRTIRFRDIQAVTYGYDDWSLGARLSYTYKSMDVYVVGLRLYDDREIRVFHFFGEGVFANNGPFPDWWYWSEYVFDLTGTQQRESRRFVELLSRMIGVSVQPSASS
jgi:hypothetical protein